MLICSGILQKVVTYLAGHCRQIHNLQFCGFLRRFCLLANWRSGSSTGSVSQVRNNLLVWSTTVVTIDRSIGKNKYFFLYLACGVSMESVLSPSHSMCWKSLTTSIVSVTPYKSKKEIQKTSPKRSDDPSRHTDQHRFLYF